MTNAELAKLARLMDGYYSCIDRIRALQTEAAALKNEIIHSCVPGRYERGTVYKVAKAQIEVRAYVRHGYTAIARRGGQRG